MDEPRCAEETVKWSATGGTRAHTEASRCRGAVIARDLVHDIFLKHGFA